MTNDLETLLEKLTIPPDILRLEAIQESPSSLKIEQWRNTLASTLSDILVLLRAEEENLCMIDKANVVFVLLPLIPSELWMRSRPDGPSILLPEWSTAGSLRVAEGQVGSLFFLLEVAPLTQNAELIKSLSILCRPSTELIGLVLTDKLRPIFKSSPHPHLSSQTGRKLARPAGGSMAMQDYYEGQLWKQYPGIANVVLWCVDALESEAFEQLWHLVIPPVMTFLDDFEARYKLQGVIIVREMLPRLPKGLVKRTGVDGLIQQSLRNSLAHLESSETPDLITAAIHASIDLTLQTTSPAHGADPTCERFDQLCSLLGDGIVSGIWLYADDKPAVVHATFEALPYLIRVLGMGSIRFLQVLVPQLTHTLIPRPFMSSQRGMQIAALDVLATVLDVCAPRIASWKETILDGIGRCWVGIIDDEEKERSGLLQDVKRAKERDDVKNTLPRICVKLAQVCPSVLEEEYTRFLKADKTLFQGLLSEALMLKNRGDSTSPS